MILSTKARESIKTALAITIAYGIALSMNWERPHWAGFAVAFISLATIGQSINKGAMRMLGTVVASGVALVIIGLYAQDRWQFMVVLSAWVALCTYMMGGAKQQYFWNVCGFVVVVICFDAGPNAVGAFETAVLRAEETGLGILVYSLVAILLWPTNSGQQFHGAASALAEAQRNSYRAYIEQIANRTNSQAAQAPRSAAVQARTRFGQLLDAAVTDTYEVWERRVEWRRFGNQAREMAEAMERSREGFNELLTLDVLRLLPNLANFRAELDRRFVAIAAMLKGSALDTGPSVVELEVDRAAVSKLNHLDTAALSVARTELLEMERLTRAMFAAVAALEDFRNDGGGVLDSDKAGFVLLPEPDRIAAIVKVWCTMWIAYLMVFYISDLPGGFSFVTMATVFSMITANAPNLRLWNLFLPAFTSVVLAGVVYIFVMPHLSTFLELGALLFVVSGSICYLFAAPQQAIGRAFGLAMFMVIAGIANEQTYSFLSVANTALIFPLVFVLLAATAHIPFSRRPELGYLRQLRRFFRSCDYLVAGTKAQDPGRIGLLRRQLTAYHAREVATLPAKMENSIRSIDPALLPGDAAQAVGDTVTNLQTLARRIHLLLDASRLDQADALIDTMADEGPAWRRGIERSFGHLSRDPGAGDGRAFRDGLEQVTTGIEERIKQALDDIPQGSVSAIESENFYRLLGTFRGVSEALVDYVERAGAVDWNRWREERFA